MGPRSKQEKTIEKVLIFINHPDANFHTSYSYKIKILNCNEENERFFGSDQKQKIVFYPTV